MVLIKSELIALLQKEVRILLHLAGKIDRAALDYRPTPKQRSTIELLRYLTMMGPMLVRYAKGEVMDAAAMSEAVQAADARDFEQTLAAIAAHTETYAALLTDMSDVDFRAEFKGFDGGATTRGQFMVNHVLGQCAAYRMQLFLYLKACGREELNTMNLWAGTDMPAIQSRNSAARSSRALPLDVARPYRRICCTGREEPQGQRFLAAGGCLIPRPSEPGGLGRADITTCLRIGQKPSPG
jgi:hypothetical protein